MDTAPQSDAYLKNGKPSKQRRKLESDILPKYLVKINMRKRTIDHMLIPKKWSNSQLAEHRKTKPRLKGYRLYTGKSWKEAVKKATGAESIRVKKRA